jgi:hypothetical protein
MSSRLSRLLLFTGMLLALAMPAVASAHRGHDGDHGANRSCRAVRNGNVPRGLTAAQANAIAAACTARAGALATAATAFDTATKQASDTYKATVTPLVDKIRAAKEAKRTACRPDRTTQACTDARAAYRKTVADARPLLRAARDAYRDAVRPALTAYRTAVRAAQDAFRAAVNQALGRS